MSNFRARKLFPSGQPALPALVTASSSSSVGDSKSQSDIGATTDYLREREVVPLLNDMVDYLLDARASVHSHRDVLSALFSFLETLERRGVTVSSEKDPGDHTNHTAAEGAILTSKQVGKPAERKAPVERKRSSLNSEYVNVRFSGEVQRIPLVESTGERHEPSSKEEQTPVNVELVVENPVALRLLLDAAHRDVTPVLSLLHEPAPSITTDVSNLGVELLQRSAFVSGNSEEQFVNVVEKPSSSNGSWRERYFLRRFGTCLPVLSMLANHHSLHRKIAYAVDPAPSEEGDEAFDKGEQLGKVPPLSRRRGSSAVQLERLRGSFYDEASPRRKARFMMGDPSPTLFLLKAADRQNTPNLSLVIDHARETLGKTVTAKTLGLELIQRSTTSELFQTLPMLNNHWMVRGQIMIAVDSNSRRGSSDSRRSSNDSRRTSS